MDTKEAGARGGKSRSPDKLRAVRRNLTSARAELTPKERADNGRSGARKREEIKGLARLVSPLLRTRERVALAAGDLSPFERPSLKRAITLTPTTKNLRLLAKAILRLSP
jgi:hypothetical protein